MPATHEQSGCLSLIFPFLNRSKKETAPEPISFPFLNPAQKEIAPKPLPYRLRDDFLSPAEFSFYKVLSLLTSAQFTIQSKVRLADIFFVARPNENAAFFSKIAQKHLDFLICDSTTMKPLLGIELDDSSHRRNDRQERDAFVEDVCKTAGLPLLRFPVQREYTPREIAASLAPYLQNKIPTPVAAPIEPGKPSAGSTPLCPKCGIPMVLRTVAQGEHKGKQFYGCLNYPRCRMMKPLTMQSDSPKQSQN